MKKTFKLTRADIKAMQSRSQLLAFAKSCGGDVQRFWDTCPRGDWLLWLIRKIGYLNEMDARKVGLAYAKKVLPVFEKTYPFNSNPSDCLKAVEDYIENPTVVNQRAMSNAAYEIQTTYTAYAAASAIYHAAYFSHAIGTTDDAIHFATAATDIVKAGCPHCNFCLRIDDDARKEFENWGANTVRSIIKLKKLKIKTPATTRRDSNQDYP